MVKLEDAYMLRYECKKILVHGRGILFLCIYFVARLLLLCGSENTYNEQIEKNRLAYESYMDELQGRLTEEKEAFLKKEETLIEESSIALAEIRQAYYAGKLSEDDYMTQSNALKKKIAMKKSFEEIFEQYIYVREKPEERYFLYTNGWNGLLAHQNVDWLLVVLILALIVPVFCEEYQCDMNSLLLTEKKGALYLADYKIGMSVVIVMGISTISILLEYAFFAWQYGLPCGDFPVQSLVYYQNTVKQISLNQAYIFQSSMRIFGCIYCTVVILFISSYLKKYAMTLMGGAIVLLLPFFTIPKYNLFARIPAPWGYMVGTVFLEGNEYFTNIYTGQKELLWEEISWNSWRGIMLISILIEIILIYLIIKRNRNLWLESRRSDCLLKIFRKKANKNCFLLLFVILCQFCLSSCQSDYTESNKTIYNLDTRESYETNEYSIYFLDSQLLCEDQISGIRWNAVRNPLKGSFK